jgi:IS1 family transposase
MVLNALVEGNSIRGTARLVGVQKNTVLKLLCRAGKACEQIMDATMRDLPCKHIALDEVWAFVYKKQRMVTASDRRGHPEYGDNFIFISFDEDSRLIPSFHIGKRDFETTLAFVRDLEQRLAGPVQITTDAFASYTPAIHMAFLPKDVSYATQVKQYSTEYAGRDRYAPPRISNIETEIIIGEPDPTRISTSLLERQNWTLRGRLRRLTRLSNGFSRKLENLRAAVALYVVHMDFIRIHGSLRVTPAMEAGIADTLWTMRDVLDWTTA